MAKEFFKNTAEAFKVLVNETKEAGKRFVESEPVQNVASDIKQKVQEFEVSDLGAKIQDTIEKVGDDISHQVRKLYKVCPVCGRKMAASDNYCATCGNPLPKEIVVWEEAEAAEPVATAEETAEESETVDAPVAEETKEEV